MRDTPVQDEQVPPAATTDLELGGDEDLLAGRYRLGEPLGEGGMGQVYAAEHVLMKKQVAIKILRPELSQNAEMVARFQREAQAAAALDTPHVCQATDFGQTDDGSFFLVMEFLHGETLQQTLKTFGRLPISRAFHIARQVATALTEAHRNGIVHRDLKPENIMLVSRDDDADTVKIMDFGIARIVADADSQEPTQLTRQGVVYGTPHYMSPEQVAGEEVDHRTDIYALGVVLFEMLTGVPPYDGDNIARVMGQHITSPIPALAERCQDTTYPKAIEDLVQTMLAKDRDARPQTASELLELIDEAAELARRPAALVPDLAKATTVATEALSSGARSTGEMTMTALERAIALFLWALEQGWRRWTSYPSSERRMVALAALLTTFIIIVAVVLLTVAISDDRQTQRIEEQRASLLQEETVAQALDAAASGEREALNQLLLSRSDDAHLHYLALMADRESGRSISLVDEAAQILELDPRYAHDEELMKLLAARIHSTEDGEAARELLRDHLTPTAREALSEIARLNSRRSRRNAAYEFLVEEKALQKLDKWDRLGVELRQASGCDDYRRKLDATARHGDPRLLATLEALQATPKTGCGTLRLRDCIGCIRGELRDAIQTLENIEE